MLTSLAILLPSPPTLCTRVVPAGLQSPTFLQPQKLMTLSYLRLGLKLWLVSHLSYFLFCLFPGFCGGGDAISSMWFCMLQSGLSSPSKILMINQKTWRRKSLRRKLKNVLVKVSWVLIGIFISCHISIMRGQASYSRRCLLAEQHGPVLSFYQRKSNYHSGATLWKSLSSLESLKKGSYV